MSQIPASEAFANHLNQTLLKGRSQEKIVPSNRARSNTIAKDDVPTPDTAVKEKTDLIEEQTNRIEMKSDGQQLLKTKKNTMTNIDDDGKLVLFTNEAGNISVKSGHLKRLLRRLLDPNAYGNNAINAR